MTQPLITIDAEKFRAMILERAKTRDRNGKVTNQVILENLMLTQHWTDPKGSDWAVGGAAPMAKGQNQIIFIFKDADEARIYCVPTPTHPGSLSRYVISRVPGVLDLDFQKTDNAALFAAWIAIELRDVDINTPAVRWEDEVKEDGE